MARRRRRSTSQRAAMRGLKSGRFSLVSKLPRRINARSGGYSGLELKFLDSETVADAFTLGWNTMQDATRKCLTACAQGNGEDQCIGRVYHIKSIDVIGEINADGVLADASAASDMVARIILVLDTQTNAAETTASLVMDGSGNKDYLSHLNMQYTGRFRILFDKKLILKRNSGASQSVANQFAAGIAISPIFHFKKTFAGKGIKVVRNAGTAGVVASITDNTISLIGCASTSDCNLNYQCRVRFYG